jgi:type VI secretion system Hcp family effector
MPFDAFMKVDGIEGESVDAEHKGWIELQSYSYGAAQSINKSASSSGGASVGGVSLGDFHISKYVDKATPKLFERCCNGTHINSVIIRLHRSGGEKFKYLDVVLEEVLISSVSGQGAEYSGFAIEDLTLNFGRIKFEYSQQRRTDGGIVGVVSGGWDRTANRPFA